MTERKGGSDVGELINYVDRVYLLNIEANRLSTAWLVGGILHMTWLYGCWKSHLLLSMSSVKCLYWWLMDWSATFVCQSELIDSKSHFNNVDHRSSITNAILCPVIRNVALDCWLIILLSWYIKIEKTLTTTNQQRCRSVSLGKLSVSSTKSHKRDREQSISMCHWLQPGAILLHFYLPKSTVHTPLPHFLTFGF